MITSKHLLLAAAFVLLTGLSAGALGQDKMGSPALPLPSEPIVKVNAIEVTDGTLGYDSETKQQTIFGYSFLGRTTGAFPGSLTLSMNCTPPPAGVDKGGMVDPILPPSIAITSGSWTLPVYTTGIGTTDYAGSLYGTIAKGEMKWDETGTTAILYIVLNVDGGTQSWAGVKGYVTFTGTLLVDQKTQKTTLTGGLVFNIINATPVP